MSSHGKREGRAFWHWYSAEDSPEERRLIRKLDLLIIPYAVIAYWIKYIDQSNISKIHLLSTCYFISVPELPEANIKSANAYISGLQADLKFNKNQLVDIGAM